MTDKQTTKAKIITLVLLLGGTLGTFFALSAFPSSLKLYSSDSILSHRDDTTEAFNAFLSKYGKHYLTTDEYLARYAIFRTNLKYIQEHNSQKGVDY